MAGTLSTEKVEDYPKTVTSATIKLGKLFFFFSVEFCNGKFKSSRDRERERWCWDADFARNGGNDD
jgi:hypothetical protein